MTPGQDQAMKRRKSAPADAVELRRRAEKRLKTRDQGPKAGVDPRYLLQELQVHQIEQEMQNEELRRAQQELEASRAKYFDLYDLAPVGYVLLSEQDLILEINLTAAKLLGVERSRLVRQPMTRFIVRGDQDIYCLHHKRLFETGAPQACELRMVRPDGAPFWVCMNAEVARDHASGPPLSRVALSDITERRQAEAALRESEARYRLLAEATQDMIYVIDRDDRIEFVNGAAARALGQPPQDVIGKARASFFPPEIAEQQRRSLQKVFATGEPFFAERHIVFPHGERWINAQLVPFRREGGKVAAVMGVSRDLTERKRAEQADLVHYAIKAGLAKL